MKCAYYMILRFFFFEKLRFFVDPRFQIPDPGGIRNGIRNGDQENTLSFSIFSFLNMTLHATSQQNALKPLWTSVFYQIFTLLDSVWHKNKKYWQRVLKVDPGRCAPLHLSHFMLPCFNFYLLWYLISTWIGFVSHFATICNTHDRQMDRRPSILPFFLDLRIYNRCWRVVNVGYRYFLESNWAEFE